MNMEKQKRKVIHEKNREQFTLDLAEHGTAELRYAMVENHKHEIMDFTHTWVPPEARNHGFGSALVKRGLMFAQQQGFKVRGSCPFVEDFLNSRPEYEDLRAG